MSDELAALAADAYIYGYPLIFDLQMAGGHAELGLITPAPFNSFSHASRLAGPDDRFVSINNDTIYSLAQADVSGGPVLLRVPDTAGGITCCSSSSPRTGPPSGCPLATLRDAIYRADVSTRYITACAPRGDGDSQRGSVMSSGQLYDSIGATYTVTRRTEPRIAAQVWAALGDARTVVNVGAGTGSYEPPGRAVTAVEPSALMRAQRPAGAAPCVAAAAQSLPFEDQSFDAAMAVSTVHHWPDPIAGLREMRRVARRVVVFTHDNSDTGWRRRFWLTRDYLPEVTDLFAGRPSLTELARAIGARIEPVLIPWDCADGFFEAYWRRPEAYLDENVRRGISVWARVGPQAEQRAVRSLRNDLASGRWAERNRDLAALDAAELGLRLLIA